MNSRTWVFPVLFCGFLLLFVLMFLGAMVWGAADTSVRDVWLALTSSETNQKMNILREIRFPREVAAIGVGAALAVSGAIMQGMTRNPLADPGLLGLTAGANAALAIAMAFLPGLDYFGIMIACFIGAGMGSLIVFGLGGGSSPFRLVLAGAAVSTFLFAVAEGTALIFKISKDVSMWTAGGLIGTTWNQLLWVMPVIFIGLLAALYFSRQLTILSLNEEVAVGLGQNTQHIKGILLIITILLAGASVSLAGNMVFVGLVVPHMVRAVVGADYRLIIPSAAIIGATFMLLADTLGRTIQAPYETPVVAIMAMIGLPFFLVIVRKGGQSFP
ncbi:FecCD family ABC transporter permease [Kroppenstedtia eburnea]|uniref:Iron complex transport system permease protein n=1 Tax=Kroppenstedtia eburnea TaxID=714067 RepID=A0A1N7KQC2_9BACL|nr:iron ABC transporter permease [Kroppenstedtia eburnea]QKI82862.1 iron ABC transporter permease [Kroppenstedtia eburnea]SIS63777.1 iron complex transport system permease protein [Kroppenstedtia eburnea]